MGAPVSARLTENEHIVIVDNDALTVRNFRVVHDIREVAQRGVGGLGVVTHVLADAVFHRRHLIGIGSAAVHAVEEAGVQAAKRTGRKSVTIQLANKRHDSKKTQNRLEVRGTVARIHNVQVQRLGVEIPNVCEDITNQLEQGQGVDNRHLYVHITLDCALLGARSRKNTQGTVGIDLNV